MSIDYKEFYKFSYNYLCAMLPKGITEQNLNRYFVGVYNLKNLKEAYIGMIRSVQNYQYMPNVIAFDKRREQIKRILHNFDYDYISTINVDDLYHTFRKEFKVTSKDSRMNSWYRWSCSVIDSAKYFREFKDIEDFNSYVNSSEAISIPMDISNKIRGIGFALACDFLKESGYVRFIKPDVHMTDICEAMNFSDRNQINVFNKLIEIATKSNVTPYKLDKILWLICSGNFYFDNINIVGKKKEFIQALKEKFEKDEIATDIFKREYEEEKKKRQKLQYEYETLKLREENRKLQEEINRLKRESGQL